MLNVNISFNSEQHKNLLRALCSRRDLSRTEMNKFSDMWIQQDESYKGYLKETDVTKTAKKKKRSDGRLEFYTIEIPYSYAIASTAHTYWSTVQFARTPVLQFSGRHGESQNSVQAVEAIIDYQLRVGEMLGPMYVWYHDLAKHGVGILWDWWDQTFSQVSSIEEIPVTLFGVEIGKKKRQKLVKRISGYHGNRVFNVRLLDYYPDPRVPLIDPQQGEFVGRRFETSWNTIIRKEAIGEYINIDQLKDRVRTKLREEGSISQNPPSNDTDVLHPLEMGVDYVEGFEMVVDIIPKSWGLGNTSYPEKWKFTVAMDEVIIEARPQGYLHDEFPVSVLEFDPSNYELIKPSLIDRTRPLSDTITWLFNTHFWNVRKSLNDVRIVDPSRIILTDLLNPKPGSIIRVRPEAMGTDVRTAVHQLNVRDTTQTHIRDAQIVEQMIQRVTGVVDNLMGLVNTSGRKTATEVRTASGFSMNRLKTVADYNSVRGMASLAKRMVVTTQQLYQQDLKLAIVGNTAQNANAFINVTPESLAGFYDYVPVDGTLPVDRLAQANFWRELMQTLARAPELGQQFDLGRMVTHTMSLLGERNVDSFRIQVRPDQELEQESRRGNLVPIGAR